MKEKIDFKQKDIANQSAVFQKNYSSLDKFFRREEIKLYAADLARQNVAKRYTQA